MKKNESLLDRQKAEVFLENVLEKMGFKNSVVESTEDDETIKIELTTVGSGNLIGYRGELLDALQYLTTVTVSKDSKDAKRISLDTEGYRKRREEALRVLALNLEKKVKRTGKAATLEPMNAYERRIIHTALQNSKIVSTESQGEGLGRHVVVSPKISNDILNAPGKRATLNFVYRSEKKRRR